MAKNHFFRRYLANFNVKPLIKIEHVVKTYGEAPFETHALDDVSLSVNPGEFVAIIGPSGSGKSTLMNHIGCLDKPTKGRYFFEGKSTFDLSENALAKIRNEKIGFVFQSFNLLPRTSALKNVAMPLLYGTVSTDERLSRATAMLEKVGFSDKLESTPAKLSGGQQQRVAIARALVNNPAVILADEPTGNLDSKSSAEIMGILAKLNSEGKTIIIITHEKEIASYAKRIIEMKDGKITSDRKHQGKKSKVKNDDLLKRKS